MTTPTPGTRELSSIVCCGPRSSKNITGVALAFDLLINSLQTHGIPVTVVDTTCGRTIRRSGAITATRSIETIAVIAKTCVALLNHQILYAPMSTSRAGFFREYIVVWLAKKMNRRTVLHLHGGGFESFYENSSHTLRNAIKRHLDRVDTLVVLGKALQCQFTCVNEKLQEKTVVVHNSLPKGINEPPSKIKQLPESEPIQLLYMSSLMVTKGYIDVMRAASILEESFPGMFHLNLCGDFKETINDIPGDIRDVESLLQFITKHRLTKTITYHGTVTESQKQFQLEQSHFFLLPTYYQWEGQPLSIIEAMAFATPTITCEHRGIPDIITNNVNGRFVPPESPRSIANAVLELSSNREHYRHMSRSCRSRYEKSFTRNQHLIALQEAILGPASVGANTCQVRRNSNN